MKRIALALVFAIAGITAPARAAIEVSFDFFHDSLEPYGEWVEAGDYGPVWHPADVDEEWSPYTDGYWAYTDGGWTWVSYEDWGGITYHYGRWCRVGGLGWCWTPGYEWAPAWVSWRRSDDYIGWAPLPPECRWRRNTGFGTWVDAEFDIGPGFFRFCRVRDFGAPVLRGVLLPCARNVTIINQTVNITNITYRNDRGHAFIGGPDYNWISPLARQPVPRLKLVQNTTNVFVRGNRENVFVNAQRGNTLVVGAPPAALNAATAVPRAGFVKRSITAPQIDRGWAGLKGDPARESIAAKIRQDAQGQTPQTAPARPFNPAHVAMVPKNADPTAKLPAHANVPASPSVPAATPLQPPQPGVPPPTAVVPKSNSYGNGSPRLGVVPQAPTTAPTGVPAIPPATASVPKSNRYGKGSPGLGVVPQPPTPATTGVPAIPKPAPVPTAEARPHPFVPTAPPTTGTPVTDSAARSGRAPASRSGKSQPEEAARALEQQRAATAAHRNQQAALEAQRARQAQIETQQRQAAGADLARRKTEAAGQAAAEQQRIEAARRQAAMQKAPAAVPQAGHRPGEFPPHGQARGGNPIAPAAVPQASRRSADFPPQGQARGGNPAPQDPRKLKGKGDPNKP